MTRRPLNRLLREEDGFTLMETLVSATGMVVIIAAIASLAEVAAKVAPEERERVHAMRDAEVGVSKMTRELREAHAISVANFKVVASVVRAGTTVSVTFDCSGSPVNGLRTCFRTQTGGTGAGTTTAIANVANANSRPVFTQTTRNDGGGAPWITYVKTVIEVPARGERNSGNGAASNVVLEDGFYLRNVDALH